MSWMVDGVGRFLAHYLEKPVHGYEPFTPSDPESLRATLRTGDVLLVEGNNHISGVIKYLTQSTWSHAALYVGPIGDRETAGDVVVAFDQQYVAGSQRRAQRFGIGRRERLIAVHRLFQIVRQKAPNPIDHPAHHRPSAPVLGAQDVPRALRIFRALSLAGEFGEESLRFGSPVNPARSEITDC